MLFDELESKFGSGDLKFDDTKLLWYKKGEFIIKFKDWKGIAPLSNEFEFDGGFKSKILKVCKFSENTLVLFQQSDSKLDLDLSLISYSVNNDNVILQINYNYILYSPGGDDTPVARGPLSDSNIKLKKRTRFTQYSEYKNYFSANFSSYSNNECSPNLEILSKNNHEDLINKTEIVAILDTGIDINWVHIEKRGAFYKGYNLVESSILETENIPFDDDYDYKHGTRISSIILNSIKGIKILPIKAFDWDGKADLFNILCSFEICMKYEVKVINASWGFYCKESIEIFEEYIKSLELKKIWLINAAGNSSDIVKRGKVDIGNISVNYINRNLGLTNVKIKRYPACYSENHNNVVTVTSLKSIQKSVPVIEDSFISSLKEFFGFESEKKKTQIIKTYYFVVENYSIEFVSIGVLGPGENGEFLDPFYTFENHRVIVGTSYATPYISTLFLLKYLVPSLENKLSILNDNSFEGLKYKANGISNTPGSPNYGNTSIINNIGTLATTITPTVLDSNSLEIEGSRVYDVNQ